MTVPHRGSPSIWRRTPALFVLAALMLLASARLHAHPASETSVVIALRDRHTVEIAVASDAAALVAKLEARSDVPPSQPVPTTRDALTARLTGLGDALAGSVALSFDSVRLSTWPGTVSVDDRGLATMHLEGRLPEGVSTLTWSTDLMYGAYPLVVRRGEGMESIYWLDGRAASEPIAIDELVASGVSVWSGLWLGFTHIIPKGLDHILFVLGLFLLSPIVRPLLWQVSAFTIAHTVTLGLGLAGLVTVPAGVVEPLIAVSVAYVGVENLVTSRLRPWRVVIVFAFGLLHGLGFAGAMSELPYSRSDLLGMLLSFNVGVELGQLAVIATAALLMHALLARREPWQRPIARFASAGVGITGLIWTVERLGA